MLWTLPLTKRLFSLSQGLTQYFLSQTLLCITVCLFSVYISSVFGSSPFRIVRENGSLVFTCWYAHACLAGLSSSACIHVFLHLQGKAAVWILLGKKRSAKENFIIGLAVTFILVLHAKWKSQSILASVCNSSILLTLLCNTWQALIWSSLMLSSERMKSQLPLLYF